MERQANSSERRFSKYELCRDMERNPQFYEAACFYLAVKQSEEESSHLKNVSKKSCAKKDAKSVLAKDEGGNGTMEEEEDDGDDDRPLNELDVIRAANLLEGTFRTCSTLSEIGQRVFLFHWMFYQVAAVTKLFKLEK